MSTDHERTVTLLSTRSIFEADLIAAALRERGVDARVLDAQNVQLWAGAFGEAKVVVLESHESSAREALKDIRAESLQIDWSGVDVGPERDDSQRRALGKHRRFVWTCAVLLVPVGLFVFSDGTVRYNPTKQLVGGALLACSAIMAAYLLFSSEARSGEGG